MSERAPDIWIVLGESTAAIGSATAPQAASSKASEAPPSFWRRLRLQLPWVALDLIAVIVWTYIFVQIFLVDVPSLLFGQQAITMRFLILGRIIPIAFTSLLVSTFFWRWSIVWRFIYVAGFPLIVVGWKLPKIFWKTRIIRNTVAVMAVLNAAMLLVRSTRYHVASKSIAVIAVCLILFLESRRLQLAGAAAIFGLLVWSIGRVLIQTFRAKTFVTSQRRLLELVSRATDGPLQITVPPHADGALTKVQIDQFANAIQAAAVVNRALYLWAYKLQQYRESSFILVFNCLSYAGLFVGSTFAFFFINLAIARTIPNQFAGNPHPSFVAVYLYSLSSMAFADGGGIVASGDVAYLARIAAGLFGPGFTLTVLVNAFLVLRGTREDADLRQTVNDLRRKARAHEEKFRDTLSIGIDEACDRLVRLGLGNALILANWVRERIPRDFIYDATDG